MLPKKQRFTTKLFELTFHKGRRVRIGSFLFIVLPSRHGGHFAVNVSKKTTKSAVKRNRIRRQLYEIIRTHWQEAFSRSHIVFLYNGPEIFQNAEDFKNALSTLSHKLS